MKLPRNLLTNPDPYMTAQAPLPPALPPEPEMRAYDPTLRQRFTNMLAQAGSQSGLTPAHGAHTRANSLMELSGAGDLLNVPTALSQGNIGEAAISAAMAGVPMPGARVANTANRMRRTASPIDNIPGVPPARIGHNGGPALDPLDRYRIEAGSRPRYTGAGEDRSGLTHLRYNPKSVPRRTQDALANLREPGNEIREEMLEAIRLGADEYGGLDWYNTEELRDWFVEELGEDVGQAEWDDFLDLMGAASPGSKVPANIGNAAAIRQRMHNDPEYREQLLNVESLEDARGLARGRKKGYGHKTQGLQELIAARIAQGKWGGKPEPDVAPGQGSWTDNPKPKGFTGSLKGNLRNIAADLHFTRYFGMASGNPEWLATGTDIGDDFAKQLLTKHPRAKNYMKERTKDGKSYVSFNARKAVKEGAVPMDDIKHNPGVWDQKPRDAEYKAMEDFMAELGDELGMTAAQVQASLWMGAAGKTGVDPTSHGTFMQLIRQRAANRAKTETKAGNPITQEEVLRRFIKEKGLLAVPGAAAVGAGATQGQQTGPQERDDWS